MSPLLRIAVAATLPSIAADVGTAPVTLDLPIRGVPGTDHVTVTCVRRQGVVRCAAPEFGVVEYSPWQHLPEGVPVAEPLGTNADGTDTVRHITTDAAYCWQLTCQCGRVRLATVNNLDKVVACRICTQARRRAAQTEWQRHKRHGAY